MIFEIIFDIVVVDLAKIVIEIAIENCTILARTLKRPAHMD